MEIQVFMVQGTGISTAPPIQKTGVLLYKFREEPLARPGAPKKKN